MQRTLLQYHPQNQPIYLEGGFKIYLRKSAITYFVLRADIPPNRRRRTPRDPDGNLFSSLINYFHVYEIMFLNSYLSYYSFFFLL